MKAKPSLTELDINQKSKSNSPHAYEKTNNELDLATSVLDFVSQSQVLLLAEMPSFFALLARLDLSIESNVEPEAEVLARVWVTLQAT